MQTEFVVNYSIYLYLNIFFILFITSYIYIYYINIYINVFTT